MGRPLSRLRSARAQARGMTLEQFLRAETKRTFLEGDGVEAQSIIGDWLHQTRRRSFQVRVF